MTKFHIATSLSIITLGIAPSFCCTTSAANLCFKNTNYEVPVTFYNLNEQLGQGHTVEGPSLADTREDYKCRFISKTYEVSTGYFLPVHKQLKIKDLEIISDDVNITDSCSLINNVLTVPSRWIRKNININFLGAEIADWITWDIIYDISEEDIKSEKHDVAQQYFEVGDYKMVHNDYKDVGYATIIGFHQQDYAYHEGKELKYKPSPFTFEILDPIDKHSWGVPLQQEPYYQVPRWEEEYCTLCSYGNETAISQKYGFTPRTVKRNKQTSEFSYFFILNLQEQTGEGIGERQKSKHSDSKPIPEESSDKAKFSYYRLNEYKCLALNTVTKRVARYAKERWVDDWVSNYDYATHSTLEQIVYIDSTGSTYGWEIYDIITEKYTSWAFCI